MKAIKPSGSRAEEILLKSAELFRKQGFSATSIRDIGDAMGVTSAALYYHFKNKDEVLLGIMRTGLTVVTDAVVQAIDGIEDPWERVQAAMREHLSVSLRYQAFAAVLLQDLRHLAPPSRRKILKLRDRYEAVWEALLEESQVAGVIRADVEPQLLRLMMFGSLNRVIDWYRPDGAHSPHEIADAFFDYIGQGVRA